MVGRHGRIFNRAGTYADKHLKAVLDSPDNGWKSTHPPPRKPENMQTAHKKVPSCCEAITFSHHMDYLAV